MAELFAPALSFSDNSDKTPPPLPLDVYLCFGTKKPNYE